MGMPDHVTCLLRNLYAGQEAIVRTRHGKADWFQIGKGVCQDCILSPGLFNFYAEYIMRNSGLDETQAEIQIPGRNISNLRYADNTTLMAESKEELKSFMANRWGNNGNSDRLFSWALKSLQMVTAAMKLKDTCSLEEML